MVPPYREKPMLYADDCRRVVQQPSVNQQRISHRVFRCCYRFTGIPNQFLPCPYVFPPWATTSAGWRIASLTRRVIKSPRKLVAVTYEGLYEGPGAQSNSITMRQLQLVGCKGTENLQTAERSLRTIKYQEPME